MVRAKFQCQRIEVVKYAGSEASNIILTPIHAANSDGTDENKAYWKYTPSGEIKLTSVNEKATEQFVPGKHYFVDFTPAD